MTSCEHHTHCVFFKYKEKWANASIILIMEKDTLTCILKCKVL